jgi:O-antigen/teichoic acid export membrane protein
VAVIADRRALITRGIVWNSAFQFFLVGASFVSMLVLVRLLSPAEFGRATAATGVLALINCLNCSYFIAQAIQLREGEEPDWAAHWQAGFYIQAGLFIICNGVGGLAWLFPAYRPIAPLLHVASIGLLIDCPNQIAVTALRRDMDFRRLRMIQAVCTILTVVSSVGLAFLGAGAYALVIGSNVLHGLPQGAYWLGVRKWRPPARWWIWPDWGAYRVPLRFGAQLSGAAMLTAARGMLEAMVLPATLGYVAVGLLNRAQVLFSTTVGRVTGLILETVYPLLPRSAGGRGQFERHATLFVETMLLISIPGAVFVGMEGPLLSRILYGSKWIAADPLIWPGTILAWAVATTLMFAAVLQAQNRLRRAFTCSVIAACACLPAIVFTVMAKNTLSYIWLLALGQAVAAGSAGVLASGYLRDGWWKRGVAVPIVVAGCAAAAVMSVTLWLGQGLQVAKLLLDSALFALVALAVMRGLFAGLLRDVVSRLPGHLYLTAALRL